MNRIERLEHRLPDALDDLAQPLGADYLPELLARTALTRQRPAWTFLERWIPMTVIARRAPGTSLHGLRVALGLGATLLLALIIAVGMLLATGSAPPGPATALRNGLIAYGFGDDIWVADADGGSPRVLVGGPTVDAGPWWSRDGSRLLFVRVLDDGEQLVTVDASGSDLRELTSGSVPGMSWFDWSPDGRRVVISWDEDGDGEPSLGLVATDGSRITPLETGMPSTFPTFHPDGSSILFRGVADGVPGLYTIPAEGGEVGGPLATSDTTTTAYAEFRGEHDLLDPSWSPDGRRIAFLRLDDVPGADIDENGWRLQVMNADGSDDREIEVSSESDDEYRPSWSSDGTRIAVQTLDAVPELRDEVAQRPAAHVAIVTPDGSADPRLLGPIAFQSHPGEPEATDYVWSPDGTSLLVIVGGSVSIIDIASGQAMHLPWRADAGQSWQPLVGR